MERSKGRFLTFEGNEGAGKTTLIQGLEKKLTERGIRSIRTREPGGVALAEKVRSWILEEPMCMEAEALLYLAARAEHVETLIRPALQKGTWVLCDRFTDSTLAYQGYGRGIDLALLQSLNAFSSKGLVPDLTFLLLVQPEVGLARVKDMNRFEKEALPFHHKIRNGFLDLSKKETARFEILDTESLNEVSTLEAALRAIEKRLL